MNFAFRTVRFILALGLLLYMTILSPAVAAELSDLIIRDVYVTGHDGQSDATLVNMQIINGRVVLVSKDHIPTADGIPVKDARKGYLLGDFEVGMPPQFIILDENPVEHFDVLQDTSTHTTFSIAEGQIVTDELEVSVEVDPPAPAQKHWISHNPPPVVMPKSFDPDKKWNAFDTKHVSGLVSGGVFLDRANWISQNDASRDQPGVGDLEDFDGGTIRAFRAGLNGYIKFKRPWHYSIWMATNAFDVSFDPDESDDFTFFDYRLDIPLADQLTLSIGKQKEPISLGRLMTLMWNPFQERTSAENAMLPSRNFGIALSGIAFDQRVTWAGGVFNNWIDSGESFGDNANQLVGRATWLPMISADESNLIHLGVAVRYDNAKQGLSYRATPEVRHAPFFVDTGSFAADSSTIVNLEAGWRKGPLWIMTELTRNDIDAPSIGNPTFSGYHVVGSWAVTGEMRPYNRRGGVFGALPVARDIRHGGYGALELVLRWSDIDLTDGTVDGGNMQVAKVGATWWANPGFNISFNYHKIWNEKGVSNGQADGFVIRFLIFTS